MRFGVNLLNYGEWASEPGRLSRWARLVEALGFDFLMVSDHVAVTPDVASRYPTPFYDPFVTLGWLAPQVPTLELGTTVTIVPYRHPLQTARLVANLDQLCGGRFIFGAGIGWARQEFDALGIAYGRRGAITDEYLAAMIQLWSSERASFEGEFCRFEDVDNRPFPVQRPHPPIWIGGASAAAMRRAVRFGDAWHPVRPRTEWLAGEGLAELRRHAAELERPVPALAPRLKLHLTDGPWPGGASSRYAGQGSIDEVRADLAALEALGATHVLLDTYTDDPADPAHAEAHWRQLVTVAERIVDLERGELRSG